jgi:hypothetical protein
VLLIPNVLRREPPADRLLSDLCGRRLYCFNNTLRIMRTVAAEFDKPCMVFLSSNNNYIILTTILLLPLSNSACPAPPTRNLPIYGRNAYIIIIRYYVHAHGSITPSKYVNHMRCKRLRRRVHSYRNSRYRKTLLGVLARE